jgi:hypothetical protein
MASLPLPPPATAQPARANSAAWYAFFEAKQSTPAIPWESGRP